MHIKMSHWNVIKRIIAQRLNIMKRTFFVTEHVSNKNSDKQMSNKHQSFVNVEQWFECLWMNMTLQLCQNWYISLLLLFDWIEPLGWIIIHERRTRNWFSLPATFNEQNIMQIQKTILEVWKKSYYDGFQWNIKQKSHFWIK